MSGFYIPNSTPTTPSPTTTTRSRSRASSAGSNSGDSDSLPYPAPLPRSAFLDPSFSPSAYLSTLHHRHQTLEDLRAELRARSQLCAAELLDLVNGNYHDFLTLGASLAGGDERVEEVRLGLLGFRKEVDAVRARVAEREAEVAALLQERVRLRRDVVLGRKLLAVNDRLEDLERRLLVKSTEKGADGEAAGGEGTLSESESEEDDEDDEEEEEGEEEGLVGAVMSLQTLRKHVQLWLYIRQCCEGIGLDHPFLVAQEPRMEKVRKALLLDLSTALKQARGSGEPGKARLMKLMSIYRDMDEVGEALKVLKSR